MYRSSHRYTPEEKARHIEFILNNPNEKVGFIRRKLNISYYYLYSLRIEMRRAEDAKVKMEPIVSEKKVDTLVSNRMWNALTKMEEQEKLIYDLIQENSDATIKDYQELINELVVIKHSAFKETVIKKYSRAI